MAEQETTFGPNAWVVDEMYDQYRADPSTVSESWRDFFADERGRDGDGDGNKAPVQTATETAQEQKPKKADKVESKKADKVESEKAEKVEPEQKKAEPKQEADEGEPI